MDTRVPMVDCGTDMLLIHVEYSETILSKILWPRVTWNTLGWLRWCAFKAKPGFRRWVGPVQEARLALNQHNTSRSGRTWEDCCLSFVWLHLNAINGMWGFIAGIYYAHFILAVEFDSLSQRVELGLLGGMGFCMCPGISWNPKKHGRGSRWIRPRSTDEDKL